MPKFMTVDDLYSFCLNNNFAKFSSETYGGEIVVGMPATFEKQKKDENRLTEGMTPFVSKAFHDHVNLNKSNIEENDFRENVPSSHLRPILANVVEDENGVKDFGSHDFEIVKDEDGNDKYIYYEKPVGVIDGTKTTIEYDEDAKVDRAILHGFLYDGYCQDVIDILDRRGETDCSVELSIRSMSFDASKKVLTLEDFYVSGLTLLGDKFNPGMQGSNLKIENFVSNEKVKFEQNPDVIKLLQELSDKIDNLSGYTNTKEGGNTQLNKFEELLKQYGKTVEDITFEYEGLSDEELEVAFEDAFVKKIADDDTATVVSDDSQGDGTADEGGEPAPAPVEPEPVEQSTDDTNTDEPGDSETFNKEELFTKLFEISFEDIRYALNALCSIYRNNDEWCYVSQVYDSYFIMEDWDSNKYYKQSYEKDGDNVSLSGERIEMFAMLLTESEKISVEEMRNNYSSISEKLEKYEAEPEKIQILESEEYSSVADKEEFVELKKQENHFDLSVDEVKTKADEIILSYAKRGQLNFSSTEDGKTVNRKTIVSNQTTTPKRSRYGGLGKKED